MVLEWTMAPQNRSGSTPRMGAGAALEVAELDCATYPSMRTTETQTQRTVMMGGLVSPRSFLGRKKIAKGIAAVTCTCSREPRP